MKLLTNGKTYNNVTGTLNDKICTIYLDGNHDIELGEELMFTSDAGQLLVAYEKADYKVWKCTGNAVHINVDEEVEPTPYEPTLEEVQEETAKAINDAVEQTITAGVDVTTSYGDEHFALTANDQANIGNMFNAVVIGAEEFPYHADGKECVVYPKADIVSLYVAMQTAVTKLTTHGNLLKQYIASLEDKAVIKAVTLATELTGELAEQETKVLTSAKTQMDAILAKLA